MQPTFDQLRASALSLLTLSSSRVPSHSLSLTSGLLVFLILLFFLLYYICSHLPLSKLALRSLRQTASIPSHVAFIMDGNRRWAQRSNLAPHQGHPAGGEKLLEALQWCLDAGITTVTVYAFSVENFKRNTTEVNAILALAERKFADFKSNTAIIHQRRVRVRVMGDLSLIPSTLRSAMARVMKDTAQYTDGPVLNICFAYAARRDMAMAIKDVAKLAVEEGVPAEEIDEAAVAACLTSGLAKGGVEGNPPELLIRTSGETRLSDFLLWESADAILCFYPVLWPDLNAWDFVRILFQYQSQLREREEWREKRGITAAGVREGLQTSAHMRMELSKASERYLEGMKVLSEEEELCCS